ncbi:MAG: dihydroorotase [Vulcanimicrobiaceae bacterium]
MNAQVSIVNARIVLPEQGVHSGSLVIRDGTVAEIRSDDKVPKSERLIDARGRYVLPGFIDPHVHFGFFPPLGQRFRSESAYALSGGITMLIHYLRRKESYLEIMPKLLPYIRQHLYQDFGYHLTLFTREQITEMPQYVNDLGIRSFKLYLDRKGPLGKDSMMDLISEEETSVRGDVDIDTAHVLASFQQASRLEDVRMNIHAEEPEIVMAETKRVKESGLDGPIAWHAARPGYSEAIAIHMIAELSRQFNVPVYFLHIGSKEAVAALAEARSRCTDFAAETGPQFAAQTIESDAGNLTKVMPPVRTAEDQAKVWSAVGDELLTCLGSDHIAYTLKEKNPGNIWETKPAFGSTGLMLPVFLTEGVHRGRMTIRQLAQIGSYNTARVFKLYPRKGTLLPGSDGDFVIVDPERQWKVKAEKDLSYSNFNIFENRTMKGGADITAVRGRVLYEDGKLVSEPGHGEYINRFNARPQ